MNQVSIRSAAFSATYLRADGTGIVSTSEFNRGIVNCQNFVGPYGRFLIERRMDGTVAIRSVAFDNVYLNIDANGFKTAADNGGGKADLQYKAGPYELFRFEEQKDGTHAIASVAFPGIYLRMKGISDQEPQGVVNSQVGVGPWEKFIISPVSPLVA
jgi:hypothetical protein